jgi:uncharacterized protein (TIGR03790 family)
MMLGALLLAAAAQPQDPAEFLILRNANVAEGAAVANAWRAWRGMEAAPELVLRLPADELIARGIYERDVAGPLRAFLTTPEGAAVRWIVPVYGMPLGITEQPGLDGSVRTEQQRNEAALDSELALLRESLLKNDGWIESTLYDRATPLGAADTFLGVIRLDGPTAEIAAGLTEKAVLAESFGASGKSFLDTRGLSDEKDGYGYRDVHMRTVRAAWERLSLDFDHDDVMDVIDPSAREDLLHYEAWYAGDPSAWSGLPRFRCGAIAVHLHSFAAHSLRNPRAYWVAPLLAAGATATFGTVFEPYTVGFPYEGIFWDRIAQGWTFGEAAVASSQLVSWQAVFLGDPLYRPYGDGFAARQAAHRAAMNSALRAWPQVPVDSPFAGFQPAWAGLDRRLRSVQELAAAGDEDAALAGLDALLFLSRGWDFDAAYAQALAPVLAADLKRKLSEIDKILVKDPADAAALARLRARAPGAALFGLQERHTEIVARVSERQLGLVEKALAEKRPGAKSGRLLSHWRSLRRAERCSYAPRVAEAGAARLAFEQDADLGPPLQAEADESLAKSLREAESLLRKEKFAEAETLLLRLQADHPPCPAQESLRALLTQAAARGV